MLKLVNTIFLPLAVASSLNTPQYAANDLPMHPFEAPLSEVITPPPTERPTRLVGKLPALGWNTWNAYATDINEHKVLEAAHSMVTLGLRDVGYVYVNIDDAWSIKSGRDPVTNRMRPDPARFPAGIKGTAAKVHALGLKMGIYSDAGTETCAHYPGSLGHEYLDATTFADWGVDYLKYDNCNVPKNWTDDNNQGPDFDWYNSKSAIRYRIMTAALNAVTRPIEFSLCIWGEAHVWSWGSIVGHSWRVTGDASADWNFISFAIAKNVKYLDYYDFWGHGDMDMLEIGNGNLTLAEERTHFAAWCFLKSPILLGTRLSDLSTVQLEIITNRELLAFHQDETIGVPAKPFIKAKGTAPPEYYVGKSSRGTHVFVINTHNSSATKTITFKDVPGLGPGSWIVHDMWTAQDVGKSEVWTVNLKAHDTAAYLVTSA